MQFGGVQRALWPMAEERLRLGEQGVKGFARDARGTNPHHSVAGGAERPMPQAYTKSRKIGAAETE